MELAVNISTYLSCLSAFRHSLVHGIHSYRHWRVHSDDISLFNQKFTGLVADLAYLNLRNGATCSELGNGPVMPSVFTSISHVSHALTCPGRSLPPERASAGLMLVARYVDFRRILSNLL